MSPDNRWQRTVFVFFSHLQSDTGNIATYWRFHFPLYYSSVLPTLALLKLTETAF